MGIKHRAITDEQKEVRYQAIIESARLLFQEKSYNSISIAQIAADINIAKGTIFLYFKTKEELFLALSCQEYQKCFMKINIKLSNFVNASMSCSIEEFLDILRSAFLENQILLRLIAINSVILEQNIDYDAALSFKLLLAAEVKKTGVLIEKVMPFLRSGEGKIILLQLQALAIGIQHLSDPAPIIKQVINNEQLEIFHIDFSDLFCVTLRSILKGLETRNF